VFALSLRLELARLVQALFGAKYFCCKVFRYAIWMSTSREIRIKSLHRDAIHTPKCR
jgi:hypothetical protein